MKNPETVEAVRGYRKRSFNMDDERSINLPLPHQKSKHTIQQDAKVLQFLKQECQRNDTPGAVTLEEIFRGLLSVHNRNLIAFADALQTEGEKWPR